jgi:hypothetical protein
VPLLGYLDYQEDTLVNSIIHFVSNHFEILLYITTSILMLFLAVLVALRLKDVSLWLLFRTTFLRLLSVILISGQLISMGLLTYLYWQNYQKSAQELVLPLDIGASTQWVRDDLRIYFIEDTRLRSVRVNGKDADEILQADDPIIEYHFSQDGLHLLILTQKELYLTNLKSKENWLVDTVKLFGTNEESRNSQETRGSIGGIQWAPDSRKFVYEVARWSKFTSQDNVYIYSLSDRSKRVIRSPTRRISSLYWGLDGEELYYLQHEAQDAAEHPAAYEVRVFRIPLTTLVPEPVALISHKDRSVPLENLNIRGIELYLENSKRSFDRFGRGDHLKTARGTFVGIDKEDYFYYVPFQWFRKRLFKVPRESRVTEIPRHQYKGGELVIDHIRWLPGDRYVIMEHQYLGVLILEPYTGKVGSLIQARGHTFGWYQG